MKIINECISTFFPFFLRYGDLMSIGDEVLVQEKAQLIPATVTNVSDFLMEGDIICTSIIDISFSLYFINFKFNSRSKCLFIYFPGAYVPLTFEGIIMVDGVLASCYPSVNHDLSQIGMTPMQWFPEVVE